MPKDIIADLQKIFVKRFNILIVDDEPDLLAVSCLHFNDLPYFNAIPARSYDEAVKIIDSASKPFNFIITDLSMPVKSGFDLLKRYKRNNGFMVAISGKSNCELGGKAVSFGALGCIARDGPGTMDRLTQFVCGYLPISFCSKGKCTRSRDVFAEIHQEGIFEVKDWEKTCQIKMRSLNRVCNKQLGLSPERFISISYGLYYLFHLHTNCKLLENLLTPVTNAETANKCLVSLHEYCCGKANN